MNLTHHSKLLKQNSTSSGENLPFFFVGFRGGIRAAFTILVGDVATLFEGPILVFKDVFRTVVKVVKTRLHAAAIRVFTEQPLNGHTRPPQHLGLGLNHFDPGEKKEK